MLVFYFIAKRLYKDERRPGALETGIITFILLSAALLSGHGAAAPRIADPRWGDFGPCVEAHATNVRHGETAMTV